MSATSACAALVLVLSACAGDGGDEVSLPPASDPDEIRRLNAGEFFLAARPATCERTLAVLIVAGRPKPHERRLKQGDCLAWANPSSNISRVVGSTRGAQRALRLGPRDLSVRLPPRFVSTTRGPLDALPRRQAFRATGAAHGPFAYYSESPGSERGTSAFYPARSRPMPLRCPSRALRGPIAKVPLKLPYTIKPNGAKGTLVLDRSGRSKPGGRPVPRGLEEVASLTCGELTIAERPAGCRVTRPVLIRARKPKPPALRLPRAGGCVVWGNQDGSEAAVRFNREVDRRDAALNHRRLWPRAAVAWDFFWRSPPDEISYTIEPGGAKGTILLD